jgi:hypothetical protein
MGEYFRSVSLVTATLYSLRELRLAEMEMILEERVVQQNIFADSSFAWVSVDQRVSNYPSISSRVLLEERRDLAKMFE